LPRQSMTALRLDEVQHGIAAAESEEAIQFLKDRGIRHRGRATRDDSLSGSQNIFSREK